LGLIGVLAIALIALIIGVVIYKRANQTNGLIISAGENRKYLLYIPESYNPRSPTPLVISLHGFIEWPAHQRDLSHWNTLADRHGFIVVYPSGTGLPLRWRTPGWSENDGSSDKDVTFISDLIDKLKSEYNIDPNRIYANGLSNGGGMTHLLACQLSDRIAAIGTVAGAYTVAWKDCHPSRPVPAIIFHGTADPIVPYSGGLSGPSRQPFPSIPEWVETIAYRYGCSEGPVALNQIGAVSEIRYSSCSGDAEVLFYTIQGGGHTWPGGKPLPKFITGLTTQDVDATQLMWDFYQQHSLR
jgi:polyhydroxybutyrate depolymerase